MIKNYDFFLFVLKKSGISNGNPGTFCKENGWGYDTFECWKNRIGIPKRAWLFLKLQLINKHFCSESSKLKKDLDIVCSELAKLKKDLDNEDPLEPLFIQYEESLKIIQDQLHNESK